ncbi:polynucleotide adenylyltransferase PcnB [Motiliproteus sediminis]|uniref:polynucleotide adenylyltransferase PcnB n=1 Tax=Motiliproteus sediminis TaxID=1468178 RepID=UPI001FE85A95|nr:polynucleotide adenylyltransferase PcnB [Motiliproteus sediminis]
MPRVIPRDQHSISRKDLSDNALKVLYRLKDGGHESYLVGGCVRDLLLGKHPKDFDVATAGHPDEVHQLFRNSRLIGRRFRLVHVRFGREIIEVATFRAAHDSQDNVSDNHSRQAESGMLLRDNVYGTVEEDALRRDFTVNALYYSIEDFAIHDYANGVEDLNNRVLRMIGDPEARYREDPVRMLRAIRFAAKLEFTIEPKTEEPIRRLSSLLADIPAARLFEEVLKLFLSGKGVITFQLLREFDLFRHLFPITDAFLNDSDDPTAERLIVEALRSTDARIRRGKSVTPAFLYAAMLWHPVQQRIERLRHDGVPPIPALHQASQEITQQQGRATSLPKRFSGPMREIWELQQRLPHRFGKRAEQLLQHPRFRAGYDFVLMREASGEDLEGLGPWWTEYQSAAIDQREEMVQQLGRSPKRPRRRRRRKPAVG